MQPGSPAARAGIRRGDIFTRIDAAPTATSGDLRRAIREREPGDRATLAGLRPEGAFTIRLTLGVVEP